MRKDDIALRVQGLAALVLAGLALAMTCRLVNTARPCAAVALAALAVAAGSAGMALLTLGARLREAVWISGWRQPRGAPRPSPAS